MFAEDLFPRLGDHDGIPAQQSADAEARVDELVQDRAAVAHPTVVRSVPVRQSGLQATLQEPMIRLAS